MSTYAAILVLYTLPKIKEKERILKAAREKQLVNYRGVPIRLSADVSKEILRENQDGGVGRHTAPPRTTRTDRKSNDKEVRHQVDKKETYMQTGRRGGDRHRGREALSHHSYST